LLRPAALAAKLFDPVGDLVAHVKLAFHIQYGVSFRICQVSFTIFVMLGETDAGSWILDSGYHPPTLED
jgi:hypothetical protein